VLETLDYIRHDKVWFEITTLLIPGENDSRAEIEAESDWLINHLGPDVPCTSRRFIRLEDDRPSADAAGNAADGAADRLQCRSSLRLYSPLRISTL
jgi:pyruvate-formate lyase-activating enzyme